jgi:Putative MetA-pathway of phenol degradation
LRNNICIERFLVFAALTLCAGILHAQAPFVTDDIDVADLHKWHVEINNEYDVLQTESFPNLRQNTSNFKISFGGFKNVEVGLDNQLLAIRNQPKVLPSAFGYGDLDLSVKWRIRSDHEHSWLPGFGASLNIELPTGDERRGLGSGVADYYLNLAFQKTVPAHTTLRFNSGFYFAGNTLTGVEGLKVTKGRVYTIGASAVHDFTPKLDLGLEIFGAYSPNIQLSRGQLQTQLGGNYKIREKFSIDFGIIGGFYQSSPRVGPIIGFSKDF